MNSTVQYPTNGAPNSNHTNGQERTKSVQRLHTELDDAVLKDPNGTIQWPR